MTATEILDLQRAAKARLGFEGAEGLWPPSYSDGLLRRPD